MANDARLGMVLGIAAVVAAAVFWMPREESAAPTPAARVQAAPGAVAITPAMPRRTGL